jgi:5-methylcytosine-specific restriction endonuclease McrA
MPYKDPEAKRANSKAHYQANKESILAKNKAYQEANHAKVLAYKKAWARAKYRSDPSKDNMRSHIYRLTHIHEIHARERAYYFENLAKAKAKARVYYLEHQEILRNRSTAYRLTHPDAGKAYALANPEKVRAYGARRRARKAGAPRNDLTPLQWQAIQEVQDHRCAYCGKRCKGRLTQDHILALSQGGSHTLHNVIGACRSCNSRKHTGPPLIPVQPLLLTI